MAEKEMKASEKLNKAYPDKEWTTENILELARNLLAEVGDLNGDAMYRLSMLAMESVEQGDEVRVALNKLRTGFWQAQGKESPETDTAL